MVTNWKHMINAARVSVTSSICMRWSAVSCTTLTDSFFSVCENAGHVEVTQALEGMRTLQRTWETILSPYCEVTRFTPCTLSLPRDLLSGRHVHKKCTVKLTQGLFDSAEKSSFLQTNKVLYKTIRTIERTMCHKICLNPSSTGLLNKPTLWHPVYTPFQLLMQLTQVTHRLCTSAFLHWSAATSMPHHRLLHQQDWELGRP